MKTKNQTEQNLLELAVQIRGERRWNLTRQPRASRAAGAQAGAGARYEVWRTRVKTPAARSRRTETRSDPRADRVAACAAPAEHIQSSLISGDLLRFGRMAPTKTSSPSTSDAARLLAKGFRFLRFDEPLESEFRTEHRSRLRVLEPHRHLRLGLHGARLRHPRSLRARRRTTRASRTSCASACTCRRSSSCCCAHLEAFLRSLVRARHRLRRAAVRHRHGHHGGVLAAQ